MIWNKNWGDHHLDLIFTLNSLYNWETLLALDIQGLFSDSYQDIISFTFQFSRSTNTLESKLSEMTKSVYHLPASRSVTLTYSGRLNGNGTWLQFHRYRSISPTSTADVLLMHGAARHPFPQLGRGKPACSHSLHSLKHHRMTHPILLDFTASSCYCQARGTVGTE